MRPLPRLPAVLRLELDTGGPDGNHLTVTTVGGTLPLYRYVPLQAAVLSGLSVPFAAHWPEHLKLFVYAYMPLPVLEAAQLPAALAQDVGARPRDISGLRPWNQATYRGWPLYLCTLETPGLPPTGGVPNLFERVPLGQSPLPPPGCGGQGP